MDSIRSFLRVSRPLTLLGLFMLYALGAGIAHYLGTYVDWGVYWLGQAWASVMMLGGLYLNEYFHQQTLPLSARGGSAIEAVRWSRLVLIAAFSCLAVTASLTVLMIDQIHLTSLVYLLMGCAFLGVISFSTPPLRLQVSGYGELLVAMILAYLTPAFAFVLQTAEWHRLLAMAGFPLVTMHLAMQLAMQFPSYASDSKYSRRILLIRMGWQRGMITHNILILSSYLLLALAALMGFPWSITWPALLSFPLGLYQILQMRRIANGEKPNWRALTVGAMSLFAGMTYLLTFAFWIN